MCFDFRRLALFPLIILGFGIASADYPRALPGYEFHFPRDHGAHPDFRTEWWYFTGNLTDESGQAFGFELTFFRHRLVPPDKPGVDSSLFAGQVYFAHFAISDVAGRCHAYWERIGRAGLGQAAASIETLNVRMGGWNAELREEEIELRAEGDGTAEDGSAITLYLKPIKPPVIHGRDGVHQKAGEAGQASHYVSFTRLEARGELTWNGERRAVKGLAWMDHEFGSDALAEDQVGWDWFALQLESGEDLMLYTMRRRNGTRDPHSSGTLVESDGSSRPVAGDEYAIDPTGEWKSPETGATYPMDWTVRLPGENAELTVTPAFEAQEMTTQRTAGSAYWEGAVTVEGTWLGKPAKGKGYVEMVGYAGEFAGL